MAIAHVLKLIKEFKALSLCLAAALSLTLAPVVANAQDSAKVKEAMASLKEETQKLGAPKLEGDALFFGTTKMNDNFTIVDQVKEKHGGTATIFAKKDSSFVRVTTNVLKDGQRAVGSVLDPNGPAYASNKDGTAFYGLVDILGKMYETGYEPIKNDAGEVIGIWYVGYIAE